MKKSTKNNSLSDDFEIIEDTVLLKYTGKGGDVVIPDFITEVGAIGGGAGYFAFGDGGTGGSIKSIAVPKSLTYIDGWTFYMCSELERITVDGKNEVYYGEGNCIIERSTKTLITACKNSVIPQDILSIGANALVNCYKPNLTYRGTKQQWRAIEKHYDWNESNRDCVIHCSDGDFTIDDEPFIVYNACLWSYRGHNAKIVIPDNVTRILADSWEGLYCFEFCRFIKSITVPKSLVHIDGDTFFGCFDLEEIIVDSQNPAYYSQGNCIIEKSTKKLIVGCKTSIIPNDVKIIGFCAFYACKNLTAINIPSSVDSIEQSAFAGCRNLTAVTLPNGIHSIADCTFRDCIGISRLTIPDGVTKIGINAFYGCSGITNITIPNSVASIGEYAFYDCRSLKTVYYGGTEADWNKLSIGEKNEALLSATIYYYSETEPTKEGSFWHYDTDGVTPAIW